MMIVSRGLFGWSPIHLTPLSDTPASQSTHYYTCTNTSPVDVHDWGEEMEQPPAPLSAADRQPAAEPIGSLFACADRLDWVLMVVGSLAAAAHGTAVVVYLHYFAKIVQMLRHQSEPPDVLFDKFTELTLTLFRIAVGVFAAGWIEVSCWILTGERQTAVMRSRYAQVLLNQDMSFFDTYGGDIVNPAMSDVLLIQSALSEKVGNYIHNMATFLSGIVIGFVNCWQIALITLGTCSLIFLVGGISNIFLHRLAENIRNTVAEAASIAEEAISYIRTLHAFTNETFAKNSYANSLKATVRYGILICLEQGLVLSFVYGFAICSFASQLWIGRFFVTHGKAHGGQIVTALFAVFLSGLGLNQAAANFHSFDQGRIAAYRLFETISCSSSTVNHVRNTLPYVQGHIEFRNVYFNDLSRPDIPILSGFYLIIPAKKTVALVGRNGSGKSSIIPLMERFYDPVLGEILLDGETIKNLKVEWLRSQIGLVTQKPALLSLSIRDNIAYGRDATSHQIEEAAKLAHVHAFVSSLEKGYETQVGSDGLALTEEQKMRLSIARAVLSNPPILLLDDVTGGLDFEAERSVQEALDLLVLGRSTIIIAQRLSLNRNIDYIGVLEGGQLVEMGTHDELITLDGLYAELLKIEEAAKLPRRMPMTNYKEITTFEIEKDSTADPPRSSAFDPETSFSHLLTSNLKNDRSDTKTFTHPRTELVKEGEEPSFSRLFELSFPEWLYAVLGSIGAAISGSLNPLLAYVIALVVSAYYRNDKHNLRQEVGKWCLLIACMGVVTVFANFLQHFFFGVMGERMTERVRNIMFSAMLRNEVGWFDEEDNNVDTLSMHLANDATLVRAAFSDRLSILVQDSAAIIGSVLIGMLLQWRLALVALATLSVLTLSAIAQKLWVTDFSKGVQEMHRKASLVLEDTVRNIYSVVAFCAGNKIMELYQLQLLKIFKQSFLHGIAIGFVFGFSRFLLFLCNALLLWYTAISVKHKYVDLPTAIEEYTVFSFVTFALVESLGLVQYILKRRKCLVPVFKIIDRVPKVDTDDNVALKPAHVYGRIEFENVDFSYPTRPEVLVLSNFSLKVNQCQTVAVVGVSGSGKSTIISLIERFYDPVAGQVLLDGLDLKLYNLRWLRNRVLGVVEQEPVIFSTTVHENIDYARHNATLAEIKEAAGIAKADDFISSLPDGYNTHVGGRGVDLTVGQKQRIALARVVLKNSPILLLDEGSSSIESGWNQVVQESVNTFVRGNKTTILIARRAAMMKYADNIVVLNEGRIVEEGNHDTLMAKNGLYVSLMQPRIAN